MSEQFIEFISNKIIIDFINKGTVAVFIMLTLHLLGSLAIKLSYKTTNTQFRINSETLYAVGKFLHELLYVFSVSISVLILILLLRGKSETIINGIIVKNMNWFTIGAYTLLMAVSIPYKIFLSDRMRFSKIINNTIIFIVVVLLFTGIIFGSVINFDYLL